MALREDELLASAWEQFKGLVEQASAEAVLYGGQPTAETGAVLARLDDHIAALEQGRQAYEHKQFVRALREGQRADGPSLACSASGCVSPAAIPARAPG